MRALVVASPGAVSLAEIASPPPALAADEALVRIRACGICATTDRELIAGTQPYHRTYPCVLGHESIGEVVALGSAVTRFQRGDLVTRPSAIWPGETRDGISSAWGGFAEWGIVRDRPASEDYLCLRQRVVPVGISLDQAVLAISLAETHSVVEGLIAQFGSFHGRRILIAGTGIAGISLAVWCQRAGAAAVHVLGRRVERLALVTALSAAHGILDDELETVAAQADVYLDAIGDAALCTRICAALPARALSAVYSVLPGHDDLVRPAANEHLSYDAVCSLLRDGTIKAAEWLADPWPLALWQQAFAAVAGGLVLKAWIRCDDAAPFREYGA